MLVTEEHMKKLEAAEIEVPESCERTNEKTQVAKKNYDVRKELEMTEI